MKKRIVAALLAFTVACSGVPINGMMPYSVQAAQVESKVDTVNTGVPLMSGTSRIQVLKGSAFDTKDVLNRVYAIDKEDGDLINSLEVISNTVDTAAVGTYSVVYKAVDRAGEASTFTCAVEVVDAFSEEGQMVQKTLYTKANSYNTTNAGMARGYNHDRQSLGVYMNSGSEIKIRIVNAQEFNKELKLELLTDDSETEKTYTIPANGDTVTITAGAILDQSNNPTGDFLYNYTKIDGEFQITDVLADAVPFIRTVQSDVQPIIEYTVGNTMEKASYYYYGDDQAAFLDNWGANDQDYAIIEGERETMLIPRRDKDYIMAGSNTPEYNFTSIDDMLEFYQDFQVTFDEFVGISYNAEDPIDENVRGKYFIKADFHGAGAAYYNGGKYTAQNNNTLRGYLSKNWLPIHEFAHGYEGGIANKEISLVDVFNNVLCHYYERNYLKSTDKGWSNLQDLDYSESEYVTYRKNHTLYEDQSYDGKLYIFVNLLNKIGEKGAMAQLHHDWRVAVAEGRSENLRNSDLIAESFSDYSGYNLVPYLEASGLVIKDATKSKIYEKNYPILYFLRNNFTADSDAKKVEHTLDVNGMYGVVSVEDLKLTGKKGDLKLNLSIDDINQLKGKIIKIRNGNEVVATKTIKGSQVTFENLPIGTYSLELPATKEGVYTHEYTYSAVKESSTVEQEVTYTKVANNAIANYTSILLKGLSDVVAVQLDFDFAKGEATIKTKAGQPHSYFNTDYLRVEVLDTDNQELYNKSFKGNTSYSAESEVVGLKIGTRIKIYHAEPTRHQVYSNAVSANIGDFALDNSQKEIEYTVTKYGLMRSDWNESKQLQVFKNQVNTYVSYLESQMSGEQAHNKNVFGKGKNIFLSAIELLDQDSKEELSNKYSKFIKGSSPSVTVNKFLRAKVGTTFDINQYLTISDVEDGEEVTKEIQQSIPVNASSKFTTVGTYTVNYKVTDSNHNVTQGSFELTVDSADKTELFKTIQTAERKKSGNYTTDSYATLTSTLEHANTIYTNKNATQSETDTANTSLRAAIAGLVVDNGTIRDIQTSDMTVVAGSEEPLSGSNTNQGPGRFVLDGNMSTMWHTAWSGSDRSLHYLTVDLGETYDVSKIIATPRNPIGNGTIKKYEVQVSTDGTTFTTVTRGNWEENTSDKEGVFKAMVPAKYVRLVSLESRTDSSRKNYSSLAELRILGKNHEESIDKTEAIGITFAEVKEAEGYTPKSYKVYTDALANVNEVVANADATKEEVDAAVHAYKVAESELTTLANKAELEAAITNGNAKVEEDYTADSYIILKNALANANAVKEDINATQAQVDLAIAKINLGLAALVDKIKEDIELPVENMVATAGTWQGGEGAEKVLDGNVSTLWHSAYEGADRGLHYITLALGDIYEISGIHATPRGNGGNGYIKKYEVEVSMDGVQFTKVAAGDWVVSAEMKEANVIKAVPAKYVRLRSVESITSDASGKEYTSLAELRVVGKHATGIVDKTQVIGISYEPLKEKGNYSQSTYDAYTQARAGAIALIEDESATQTQVNAAVKAYQDAVKALVIPVDADKTELNAMVEQARLYQEAQYTQESFNELKTALNNANAILQKPSPTKEEVNQAKQQLQTAIDGLQKKPIDRTALNTAIADANAKDANLYTTGTFANLTAALQKANEIAAKPDATQAEVDDAAEKLNAAITALVLKPADKTELNAMVEQAMLYQEAQYTQESFNALKTALNNAKAILQKPNPTKEEVNQAKLQLQTAIDGLQKKPIDRTALNTAIADANAKDANLYTTGTFANLTAALQKANEIAAKSDATQAEVDDAAKKLNAAITALVLKPVDTSEISRESMTVRAGSEQEQSGNEGPARFAIDQDEDTHWHTAWSGAERALHYIMVELDGTYNISGIHATPRKNLGNGVITKYEVQVSMDGEEFTTVSRGDWAVEAGVKNADIDAIVPAKYVKLISLESKSDGSGKEFTSLAELGIVGEAYTEIVDKTYAIGLTFEAIIEQGSYTDESYKAYTDALEALKVVIANMDATQVEVDGAVASYQSAVDGLTEIVLASSIQISDSSIELKVTEKKKLTANFTPENTTDKTLTWETSNANIVNVVNGEVTAVGSGIASVTATSTNGKTATCEVTVKKEDDNVIEPGWKKDDKGHYYVLKDGTSPTNTWWNIEEHWYYFKDKYKQTGWLTLKTGTYYLGDNGARRTGWQKSGKDWYLLGKNGKMAIGWQKSGKDWYLLEKNGKMAIGWQKSGRDWYYLNKSGKMLTSWQKVNGKWYYFNGSGKMLTNWQKIGGVWYYFESSGKMVTGWQKINKVWYYFASSGKMTTGWQKVSGKWYFMHGNGKMATGWIKDGKKEYYLNGSGVWTGRTR